MANCLIDGRRQQPLATVRGASGRTRGGDLAAGPAVSKRRVAKIMRYYKSDCSIDCKSDCSICVFKICFVTVDTNYVTFTNNVHTFIFMLILMLILMFTLLSLLTIWLLMGFDEKHARRSDQAPATPRALGLRAPHAVLRHRPARGRYSTCLGHSERDPTLRKKRIGGQNIWALTTNFLAPRWFESAGLGSHPFWCSLRTVDWLIPTSCWSVLLDPPRKSDSYLKLIRFPWFHHPMFRKHDMRRPNPWFFGNPPVQQFSAKTLQRYKHIKSTSIDCLRMFYNDVLPFFRSVLGETCGPSDAESLKTTMATHQWLTLSGTNRGSALRICTRREGVKMLHLKDAKMGRFVWRNHQHFKVRADVIKNQWSCMIDLGCIYAMLRAEYVS